MIWFRDFKIEDLPKMVKAKATILDLLGIEFTEIGPDYIKARMAVDHRTHQVSGILHGGATCVLVETIASFASLMCIDLEKYYAVGSVISVNHLRPVQDGFVTATCRPIHVGKTKHVWDVMVHADNGKLIAKGELTCAVTNNHL